MREDAGEFGPLIGLPQEILDHTGEFLDIAPTAVLEDEFEAPGGADARNRRRIQRQHVGFLDAARQLVDARRQRERAMRRAGALAPGLEDDEDGRGVGRVGTGEQIEAGDGERRLDLRLLAQHRAEFAGDRFGALQRGTHWEGNQADQVALIFVGHEAGRPGLQQPQGGRGQDQKDGDRSHTAANSGADGADVARGEALEATVKGAEEAAQDPTEMRLCRRLQQQRAQGRGEGEGNQRRNRHRYRERQCELPVELAGEAAEESHRYEHRDQHQGDRHHRAGDLLHRRLGGLPRGQLAAVHDLGSGFDHDDGIVHYEADGQYQGEQGQRIEREAKREEGAERADQ